MSNNPSDSSSFPKPKEQEPQLTGWAGLAHIGLKFLNGLTDQRMLLLTVLVAFGYLMYSLLSQQTIREADSARRYEESRERDRRYYEELRERDRRHCEEVDEKSESRRLERDKETRLWCAAQIELQRKHDLEREEKIKAMFAEQIRMLIAALGKILPKKDCPVWVEWIELFWNGQGFFPFCVPFGRCDFD